MKKLLLITLLFLYNTSYATCISQIITMPDGRTKVCVYCNDGKIVDCSYL
jgi:hypothetical protein